MARWICTKCGGSDTAVLESRPSLDDRYAVGHCARCTPLPVPDPAHPGKTKPVVRATVALGRDSDELRATIAERERVAKERRLLRNPKTDADKERVAEILARYEREAEARRSA